MRLEMVPQGDLRPRPSDGVARTRKEHRRDAGLSSGKLPASAPGKAAKPKSWCIYMGDLHEAPGIWLQPDSALTVVAIRKVNQHCLVSSSLLLCLSNKLFKNFLNLWIQVLHTFCLFTVGFPFIFSKAVSFVRHKS